MEPIDWTQAFPAAIRSDLGKKIDGNAWRFIKWTGEGWKEMGRLVSGKTGVQNAPIPEGVARANAPKLEPAGGFSKAQPTFTPKNYQTSQPPQSKLTFEEVFGPPPGSQPPSPPEPLGINDGVPVQSTSSLPAQQPPPPLPPASSGMAALGYFLLAVVIIAGVAYGVYWYRQKLRERDVETVEESGWFKV